MNRLMEVMAFEKKRNISATYFFVMRPGLGVAYTRQEATPFIKEVLRNGHYAGVHGMAYEVKDDMKEEFDAFRNITGIANFGVRMHYLRNNATTLGKLENIGYIFDSTIYENIKPYSIKRMIEFPLSVMDVYCVKSSHATGLQAKEHSLALLDHAEKRGQPYFVINFHDIYYKQEYKLYRDWFEWLIDLCIHRGYEFTSFNKEVGLWK